MEMFVVVLYIKHSDMRCDRPAEPAVHESVYLEERLFVLSSSCGSPQSVTRSARRSDGRNKQASPRPSRAQICEGEEGQKRQLFSGVWRGAGGKVRGTGRHKADDSKSDGLKMLLYGRTLVEAVLPSGGLSAGRKAGNDLDGRARAAELDGSAPVLHYASTFSAHEPHCVSANTAVN